MVSIQQVVLLLPAASPDLLSFFGLTRGPSGLVLGVPFGALPQDLAVQGL